SGWITSIKRYRSEVHSETQTGRTVGPILTRLMRSIKRLGLNINGQKLFKLTTDIVKNVVKTSFRAVFFFVLILFVTGCFTDKNYDASRYLSALEQHQFIQ